MNCFFLLDLPFCDESHESHPYSIMCDLISPLQDVYSIVSGTNFYTLAYFLFITIVIAYPFTWLISYYLDFELHEKILSEHCKDIGKAFVFNFFIFILGRYENHFQNYTILVFFVSLFLYGLTTKYPFFRFSLATIKTWSDPVKVLMIVILMGLLKFLHHLYTLANKDSNGQYWYYNVFLISIYFAIPIIQYLMNPNVYYIHVHHWQTFGALALLTQFKEFWSITLSGVSLALYMQGIVAYGPDKMLKKKKLPAASVEASPDLRPTIGSEIIQVQATV